MTLSSQQRLSAEHSNGAGRHFPIHQGLPRELHPIGPPTRLLTVQQLESCRRAVQGLSDFDDPDEPTIDTVIAFGRARGSTGKSARSVRCSHCRGADKFRSIGVGTRPQDRWPPADSFMPLRNPGYIRRSCAGCPAMSARRSRSRCRQGRNRSILDAPARTRRRLRHPRMPTRWHGSDFSDRARLRGSRSAARLATSNCLQHGNVGLQSKRLSARPRWRASICDSAPRSVLFVDGRPAGYDADRIDPTPESIEAVEVYTGDPVRRDAHAGQSTRVWSAIRRGSPAPAPENDVIKWVVVCLVK